MGAVMSERDIAKHCGVSHQWVHVVLAERAATFVAGDTKCLVLGATPIPTPEGLGLRPSATSCSVIRELCSDASQTDACIARKTGAHTQTVRKARKGMGLPALSRHARSVASRETRAQQEEKPPRAKRQKKELCSCPCPVCGQPCKYPKSADRK
jgi:hypothetical protein